MVAEIEATTRCCTPYPLPGSPVDVVFTGRSVTTTGGFRSPLGMATGMFSEGFGLETHLNCETTT